MILGFRAHRLASKSPQAVTQDSFCSVEAATQDTLGTAPLLTSLSRAFQASWQWLQLQGKLRVLRASNRRLRITETVSLGDKRFVSLIEVDGRSFLIGGGGGNVALLTTLPPQAEDQPFSSFLSSALQEKESV